MFSKFLKTSYGNIAVFRNSKLLVPKGSNQETVRVMGNYVPPTQYDTPIPRNLQLGYALREHIYVWPLFITVIFKFLLVFGIVGWKVKNAMDVVFLGDRDYSRSISRSMDLRNPTWHKLVCIRKYHDPWPEMQDVLDKMYAAQQRAIHRARACAIATRTVPPP